MVFEDEHLLVINKVRLSQNPRGLCLSKRFWRIFAGCHQGRFCDYGQRFCTCSVLQLACHSCLMRNPADDSIGMRIKTNKWSTITCVGAISRMLCCRVQPFVTIRDASQLCRKRHEQDNPDHLRSKVCRDASLVCQVSASGAVRRRRRAWWCIRPRGTPRARW